MKKLAALIVFFIVNITYAQVANDDCANAILIVPSSICSPINGTLLNATNSSITNSCSGNSDVFYKFVAVATSGTVKVAGASGLDVVVGLTNACNASTSLYCVDSYGSGGTESINMTGLTVGSTYYIKVQAYSLYAPTAYTFTICVVSTTPLPPANDGYTNAIELIPSTVCSSTAGTLLNATSSSVPTLCTGSNDVFYKFTAVATSATISVPTSYALDVVVSLFTINGGTIVPLYCINNFYSGGTETINAAGLYVGTTYYIQVQSSGVPTTSTFNICVLSSAPLTPPVNDDCLNAINLTPATTCTSIAGTLQNAATTQNAGSCYGNSDVFYKFTATASSAIISVVPSSGLDVVAAVYSDCGTNAIACTDSYYSGGTETVSLPGLTLGAVYYVKVQAYSSSLPTTFTFSVCIQSANNVVPSNDDCSGAIALSTSPSCSPTSGTLLNAGNSGITNSCSGNTDVFYSFEATAATATVSVVPASGMDVAVGVFETCSGASISCTDAQITGGTENVSLSGLITGNTYVVQVQNMGATTSANNVFSICVIGAVPPPPVNDECADAIEIYPVTAYTPITGTVKNATVSTVTGSCTGNSDVFYKFTAVAKTATITVVGSSGLDPVIGIFKACGTSYMDCADYDYNVGGTETLNPTTLTIGSTYYIKVQDYSSTLPTTFSFTVAVQSTAVATAVEASSSVQQINLFPNPAQNILNVENIQMQTTVELVDLTGRVLFSREISSDLQIDLSEFAEGVYILKLSVNGVVENRRVVLSR